MKIKLLAVIVVLLSVFPLMAYAADGAAAQDNTDAIKALYDLKIVEGTPEGDYQPTKPINRAEFAAIITRALAIPASALTSYQATLFNDTSGYDWAIPYLAFCAQRGVILGDGLGNAMPGRQISMNEAVTIILRALGWHDGDAELYGEWPANYITLATKFGLYTKVDSAEPLVTKATAAQLVYNALKINESGKTSFLSTLGGVDLGSRVITQADAERSAINLVGYLGAFGRLYANRAGDIIAIGDIETEFITGVIENGKFKAIDGVEYNIDRNASGVITFVNGADSFFNWASEPGQITLASKIGGQTITDIKSAQKWNIHSSFRYTAGDIAAGDLVEDDRYLSVNGATGPSDIPSGAIVYTYRNAAGKINRIDVGTATVQGTITEINSAKNSVHINNTAYTLSPYASPNPAINDQGTAYLDYYGRLYAFDISLAARPENFGVLVRQLSGASGLDAEFFTSRGNYKEYTVNNPAGINDGTWLGSGGPLLFRYSADSSDRRITVELPKVARSGKVNEAGTIVSFTEIVRDARGYASQVERSYPLGANAVVFSYRYGSSGLEFNAETVNTLYGADLKGGAYDTQFIVDSSSNNILAILVNYEDIGSGSLQYLYIDTVVAASYNGEARQKIYGYNALTGASEEWIYIGTALDPSAYRYSLNVYSANTASPGVLKDMSGILQATRTQPLASVQQAGTDYFLTDIGGNTYVVSGQTAVAQRNANGELELTKISRNAFTINEYAYSLKDVDSDGVYDIVFR